MREVEGMWKGGGVSGGGRGTRQILRPISGGRCDSLPLFADPNERRDKAVTQRSIDFPTATRSRAASPVPAAH